MATLYCYGCSEHFDPTSAGRPDDADYCSDDCEAKGVTDGKTFLVHYVHSDCAVQPGVTWDEENGPEYGACNSSCPACDAKDIEPRAYHDVETACTDACCAPATA